MTPGHSELDWVVVKRNFNSGFLKRSCEDTSLKTFNFLIIYDINVQFHSLLCKLFQPYLLQYQTELVLTDFVFSQAWSHTVNFKK